MNSFVALLKNTGISALRTSKCLEYN
jgi:hypothetical protein